MRLIIISIILLSAACGRDNPAPDAARPAPVAEVADASAFTPTPQWYLDDVDFRTRDGGRWIASNTDYQSEEEPFDAYGMEWKAGIFPGAMSGHLYGVIDGAPTGEFWEFNQFWHPGRGEAVIEQLGQGGAFATGRLWSDGDKSRMTQTLFAPDGGVSEVGHIATNPDADTHVTESFDIVDGEWRPRRIYTWKRVAESGAE